MTVETASGPRIDLEEANRRLDGASAWDILRWSVETFGPRLTMATAFGPEGCAILHMLSHVDPDRQVRVFNLDTGYQFPETLALRDRIAERYGIEVELVRADTTVEQFEESNGGPVYATDPDRCCFERKIVPLRRAVVGYDAWISSIRADQSEHRARASLVGWDRKFDLVKVNPLLRWSRRDVWAFVVANKVPYNPLHDQGYPSIGCWPCTRPVAEGETDERAGRWAGQAKTECGLHSLDSSQL
ncbi:phosphoadenylyl-sulfate reductase [Tautonia sociabilis]|uniref:Adenosine 5'-phosphosulfate reductase n=1 Tax=Tautonia sociabilis TaxID=2080755 RepID=A0A432MRR9_9BACT|nr:phosphoadenylyl-sulfate reductase [Tautonia sociabilis]RUL89687.1 phosphoadenylyl-sulfate reductase [Tautonia sociabilis]